MKVLHIDSSITGEASVSRTLSAAVVDRLKTASPDLEVLHRDLVAEPLSHLTIGDFFTLSGNEYLEEFKQADIVVIGTALYNFAVASQLKAWFDRILVAGETFRYGPSGAEGLAGDKRVIVTVSRGNIYSDEAPAAPFEHAESWVRSALAFIGITDPEVIVAEGVAFSEDHKAAALATALEQIGQIEPARAVA